ncbi:MAG: sugar phosphate nucleotidyltransferase [Desulforhabdus sp.]|jgi:mannose-1-phosphate guanylyltransferase|nr:sugar phosphate nucleotidyltransferase [Desulforhabdus sp.]
MRAMILAAGLGTRLRPLTRARPKVLVPVMGMPLLDFWIGKLYESGFEAVVVNAFHLPDKLVKAIHENKWPIPVEVRVEPVLLGTAGGIRNVLDFFGEEPFVVVNGDIICNVDFQSFYESHLRSGSSVSLLLHDYALFNNVAVNNGFVLGFADEARRLNREQPDVRLLAFTGIHVLEPQVLSDLEQGRPHEIIPAYRNLIEAGEPPRAYLQESLNWREIGSVEAYRAVHAELAGAPARSFAPLRSGGDISVHPQAEVSPQADLRGMVIVGRNSRVEQGAHLEDVIIWDNVTVRQNSRLLNCIVTDGMEVGGSHENEILCERND